MLISYCIPCHNRTYDLKKTLPMTIRAANVSPPVEIVVLDYNSQDDLRDYFFDTYDTAELEEGNVLTYKRYGARNYYRNAHAFNLATLAGAGEYVVVTGTDIVLAKEYFSEVRKLLEPGDVVWMHPGSYGIFVCRKDEFISAGGFDERFEFYGKEDKDLYARLVRRGGKFVPYSSKLITIITTPKEEKFKNYRITARRKTVKKMRDIYNENQKKQVLVANEGEEWGQYD